MPKATVNPETFRKELRTLPEGFVILRTLSFHEMEMRKDIAGRMYSEQLATDRQRGKNTNEEEMQRAYFESMNVKVTEFEFRNCIIDHNLFVDDAETQKIDFQKPMHTWKLDPKIGQEISDYITELTQISEDDLAPLPSPPTSSSSEEATYPSLSTVET